MLYYTGLLNEEQSLIVTLMKLRLHFGHQDLAYKLGGQHKYYLQTIPGHATLDVCEDEFLNIMV